MASGKHVLQTSGGRVFAASSQVYQLWGCGVGGQGGRAQAVRQCVHLGLCQSGAAARSCLSL